MKCAIQLLLYLFLITVFVPTTASAAESASLGKPNVVFVLVDQWRASAFGYVGDPNVKTPQIDKLATQSLRFTNAVSVCPVCTPYRAALMTGRFPTTTGMFLNDLHLPLSELCMGDMFKLQGYDTAYIGKWHLDGHGRESYIPPVRRHGFDYWKAAECTHDYPHSHYYAGDSTEKKFWDGYDAYAQTKDAQSYLRDHAKSDKPFLLFLSFGPPHFPHNTAPEELKKLYPPDNLKLSPNVTSQHEEAVRRELVGYYAHCTALDQCVGDLLATLEETGLDKTTVFVFTSDHGEMMGSHNVRPTQKHWPFNESAHIPFLLRYPGSLSREMDTPINTPDILPTLLGLAGIPIPQTVEGEDLSPILRAGGAGPDRTVLLQGVSPWIADLPEHRGIRTSRYTYVRNLAGPWLMFDNQNDPYQLRNLINESAHADLQRKLDADLQTQLDKVWDEFKPKEFYHQKWGYTIAPHGSISYAKDAPPQSPKPIEH